MIEVLWHGRGGQGAFTAARLLGAASSLSEGRYALAFPSFGPERRGAPMRAFTKLDDAPIGDRSAIVRADYAVYLDDTLLGDDWADELKPDGIVLVNSTLPFDDERIVAVDADGMSSAILGRPIPNTVFLGAISALCGQVDAEDVKEAVRQYMPAKLHAKNIAIVDAARELLEKQGPSRAAGSGCGPSGGDGPGKGKASDGAAPAADAAWTATVSPLRPDGPVIPTLRDDELRPEVYARSTCFEAGYLVAKNAGWRNIRPVVNPAACTGCLQCYLHCPDGTVYKVPPSVRPVEPADAAEIPADSMGQPARPPKQPALLVAIDYDFCKGCGVCAKVCGFDAIAMVPEREALSAKASAALADDEKKEAIAR